MDYTMLPDSPMRFSRWSALVQGSVQKRFFRPYFLLILGYFAVMVLLSQAFFPGGYYIPDHYISAQGDPALNPQGCWFFIFGAGLTGLALLPVYNYRLS